MNFLTPLYALAGLAILAPLIFHLVRRRPRERMVFSSHLFLEKSPPQVAKSRKIENWWLLFLRASAILLLAIAFARPYWGSPSVEQVAPSQTTRLLILDSSASMRREGFDNLLRDKAKAWIEHAEPTDVLAIYSAHEHLIPLLALEESLPLPYSARTQKGLDALRAYRTTWYANQWNQTLSSLLELVQKSPASGSNINAPDSTGDDPMTGNPIEIVLITDLQGSSNWSRLATIRWPENVVVHLDVVHADSQEMNNAYIRVSDAPLDSSPQPIALSNSDTSEHHHAPKRLLRISNEVTAKTTASEQFEVQWLDRSGKVLPQVPNISATVLHGKSKSIPLNELPPEAYAVRLSGDTTDYANTFHLPILDKRNRRILVLDSADATDPKSAAFFLSQVPLNSETIDFKLESIPPTTDWTDAQFVVLTSKGIAGLANETSGPLLGELQKYLQQGGHSLWVLDQPTEELFFSASELYSSLYEGSALGKLSEAADQNYAMLADLQMSDPLFAGLSDARFSDFSKVKFWHHRRFQPSTSTEWKTLAKFDNGDPAILRRKQDNAPDKGKMLLFTFGWQPEQSQLALSSKFVPLMSNLIADSIQGLGEKTSRITGEQIAIPPRTSANWIDQEGRPDGATAKPSEHEASLTLDRPGHLILKLEDSRETIIAVNIPESECELAPVDLDKLVQQQVPLHSRPGDALATREEKRNEQAANLQRKRTIAATELESNQHFWRWILCGVIALVGLESLAILRRNNPRSAASTQ